MSQHFQHKHHERPRRNVVRLMAAIRFVNDLRRSLFRLRFCDPPGWEGLALNRRNEPNMPRQPERRFERNACAEGWTRQCVARIRSLFVKFV